MILYSTYSLLIISVHTDIILLFLYIRSISVLILYQRQDHDVLFFTIQNVKILQG